MGQKIHTSRALLLMRDKRCWWSIFAITGLAMLLLTKNRPQQKEGHLQSEEHTIYNRKNIQSCGKHGSLLVDECWCDPGYEGSSCDHKQTSIDIPECSLKPLSDLCMNMKDFGRLKVSSDERHQFAGNCEMSFWRKVAVPQRNVKQASQFDNFADLPSNLGHVLELGSGPYTKLRLILEVGKIQRKVSTATLIDPSAVSYISEAKQVSYPDGNFCLNATEGFGGGCIPTLLGAFGGEVPLMEGAYDTVIMMNTIEHVQSCFGIMTNLYRALKPGGIAIYAEIFGSEQSLLRSDQCHPISQLRAFPEHFFSHFFVERGGKEIRKVIDGNAYITVVRKGA